MQRVVHWNGSRYGTGQVCTSAAISAQVVLALAAPRHSFAPRTMDVATPSPLVDNPPRCPITGRPVDLFGLKHGKSRRKGRWDKEEAEEEEEMAKQWNIFKKEKEEEKVAAAAEGAGVAAEVERARVAAEAEAARSAEQRGS